MNTNPIITPEIILQELADRLRGKSEEVEYLANIDKRFEKWLQCELALSMLDVALPVAYDIDDGVTCEILDENNEDAEFNREQVKQALEKQQQEQQQNSDQENTEKDSEDNQQDEQDQENSEQRPEQQPEQQPGQQKDQDSQQDSQDQDSQQQGEQQDEQEQKAARQAEDENKDLVERMRDALEDLVPYLGHRYWRVRDHSRKLTAELRMR